MLRIKLTIFLAAGLCVPALGQVEVFVPQVVDGSIPPRDELDFQTEFYAVNLAETPVEVEVTLTRDDGEPLRAFMFGGPPSILTNQRDFTLLPSGSAIFSTAREGGDFQVGWARFAASGPIGVLTSVRVIRRATSKVVTSAGILVDPPTQAFRSPVQITPLANTGFAILNPSEVGEADVQVELIDFGGTVVDTANLTVLPRAKIVQFLNENELFPDAGGNPGFRGSVLVTSDTPLSVVIIQVEGSSWTPFRPLPASSSPPE